MKTAYLSLGSNVGNREQHLRSAIERLDSAGIRVIRRSSLYETEPQELRGQPWFLNIVLEVETSLFPMQLLHAIQKIEKAMGRKRLVAKGPRTIDIDILLFGGFVVSTTTLQIPHPRFPQRRFVLEPLAELAPDLRHPASHQTVREMLAATRSQIVRRITAPPQTEPRPSESG